MCVFGRDVSDFLCSFFIVFHKICMRRSTELKPGKIGGYVSSEACSSQLEIAQNRKPPHVLMYLNHFHLGIDGQIFLLGDVQLQIGVMYAHLFL